jgi:crotonobetainyl-CoA:carnitine CoA-transferase CaiB-like acyl-CoA transferase
VSVGGVAARSVRVLDFSPLVAAYATRLMAEAGAEVLRVDPPPAQPGLSLPPVAEYFHAGKHGITLEPAHPLGRQVLARLLAHSDMVVLGGENAVVQRACEDYSHLVVVSVVGIEPDLDLASAELRLCATSGVLSIAGDPDGPPRLPGGHAALAAAGLQVAAAAYAALVWQRQAGRGQRVTVNLREALQHLLDQVLLRWTLRGERTRRAGNRGGATAISGTFPCRDGFVSIGVDATPAAWERLLAVLRPSGLDRELADPALRQEHARWQHRARIWAVIERWTRERTRDEIVAALHEHQLLAAPVLTVADLCADVQLLARGFLAQQSPSGRVIPRGAILTALRRSDTLGPAPWPGRDNHTVYSQLGYDMPTLEHLAALGVI